MSKRKMDEKKLTDEEIVKAFEHCNKSLPHDKCLLAEQHKEDWVTCQSKCGRMIIDLMHRLQDKIAEYERKLADGELVSKEWHDEQVLHDRAEIERLTEENENLKADILRYEDMEFTEKHCNLYSENESLKQWLKRVNADNEVLQRQVDELAYELAKKSIATEGINVTSTNISLYLHEKLLEQATKDTAKEILTDAKKWVKEHYKDTVTDSFGERPMLFMEAFGCLLAYLKDKHGVEVE